MTPGGPLALAGCEEFVKSGGGAARAAIPRNWRSKLTTARIYRAMPSYRLGQAAKMLGVSVDTVRRMVDDGRLVAVRSNGRQRLIDGASLAVVSPPKRAPKASVKQ